MTIPDEAIEAAAEAIHDRYDGECFHSPLGTVKTCERDARAAIEAAMPAIREAICEEVEAAFDADNRDGIDQIYSGDYNDGYVYAMELADRIVRGGTP